MRPLYPISSPKFIRKRVQPVFNEKASEISVSEIRYINTGSSTVAWGLSSQVHFVFCFRGCLLLLGILFHARYERAVY